MVRVHQLCWQRFLALTLILIHFLCFAPEVNAQPLPSVGQSGALISRSAVISLTQSDQTKTRSNSSLITQGSLLDFIRQIFWPSPSKKRDAPKTNASTGRREQCIDGQLIGLVPLVEKPQTITNKSSSKQKSAFSQTGQSAPTLWFYVPQLDKGVYLAQFMLQEVAKEKIPREQDKDVIKSPVAIVLQEVRHPISDIQAQDLSTIYFPSGGGISHLNLQSIGIALEPGKLYHWYFSIICDARRPSRNPSVDAWIERVVLPAEVELPNSTDKETQLKFFADYKLWHEMITTLANLRCQSQPIQSLVGTWEYLLEKTGHGELAKKALFCTGLSLPSNQRQSPTKT